MQNLRDKLLKAGLVSQQQVSKAEASKKPPARPAPQARPPSDEERQRQEAFALHEAEKAAERRQEQDRAAEARAQSERARALRVLVEEYALREPIGEVAFHYQKRSGKIGRLLVSAELQQKLEAGEVAIIEDPGKPEPALVPRVAAAKAKEIDPRAVFFWVC